MPCTLRTKMSCSRLLSLVYPRLCLLCSERLVGDEQFVCGSCREMFPKTGFLDARHNAVEQRLAGMVRFDRAMAVYYYVRGNNVSRLVHDFKYHNMPKLARWLGTQMYGELVFTDFFSDIDAVVPVPLHWTRRLRRGYNQAEEIAAGLCESAGLPVARLLRARMHISQTRRTLRQRADNASGKYYAVREDGYDGLHLLVVDDVCTTGSTLIAAVRALAEVYPQSRISVLTLAATV